MSHMRSNFFEVMTKIRIKLIILLSLQWYLSKLWILMYPFYYVNWNTSYKSIIFENVLYNHLLNLDHLLSLEAWRETHKYNNRVNKWTLLYISFLYIYLIIHIKTSFMWERK